MITLLMISCWLSPWSGISVPPERTFVTRPANGAAGIKISHAWLRERAQVTVSNT
jgi:hypothetical protein